jgi:hypothetical protein
MVLLSAPRAWPSKAILSYFSEGRVPGTRSAAPICQPNRAISAASARPSSRALVNAAAWSGNRRDARSRLAPLSLPSLNAPFQRDAAIGRPASPSRARTASTVPKPCPNENACVTPSLGLADTASIHTPIRLRCASPSMSRTVQHSPTASTRRRSPPSLLRSTLTGMSRTSISTPLPSSSASAPDKPGSMPSVQSPLLMAPG